MKPLQTIRPRCDEDGASLRFVLLLEFPNGDWLVVRESDLKPAGRGTLAFRKSVQGYMVAEESPFAVGLIPVELAEGVS